MTHACLRCRRGRRRCQPGPNGSACERCSRHGKQDQCSYKDVGQVRQPQRHSKTNDADETHPPQTLPDSSPSATGTPVPSIRQPFDMPSLSPDFLTQPPLSKSATPVPHSIQLLQPYFVFKQCSTFSVTCTSSASLNQLLLTLDTSLAHCEQNNWITEDPDMMPTNLTNEGLTAPLLQSWMENAVFNILYTHSIAEIDSLRIPTLETVQAYYNIYLYATFLEMALQMIKQLRLDVDPDYSPWINHLNLAPRQKEEGDGHFGHPHWEIRKFNAIPPISVDELFLSQSWPSLLTPWAIHATIPENFLLLALSPENTLQLLITIPQPGPTLHPTPRHNCLFYKHVLASAHRITSLFSFFRNISTGDLKHLLQEGEHSYHKPDYYSVYALFEAVCVFWFMACRMNPLWWNLISRGECDRKSCRRFVKAMEKDSAGL
ncbi:hypothetical protein BCR33DRAFT_716791 [Rhizoclosmatium globosum]|uniref:Zn(2)-C6 fungal-type domain-containing protein n=1 Tax=Rhizoclosmatium globosum TaxID=329046 RepID=A0A1Y2CEW9_9FUNG|nr:hypothetical protein BCR33DRAFT_716791 [Rhizoclosmatium globosum]|eukprot:ORY44845.1 hypothetical protein BCR33DRAFT_716791 [Rhizoclosmatium globosum]